MLPTNLINIQEEGGGGGGIRKEDILLLEAIHLQEEEEGRILMEGLGEEGDLEEGGEKGEVEEAIHPIKMEMGDTNLRIIFKMKFFKNSRLTTDTTKQV